MSFDDLYEQITYVPLISYKLERFKALGKNKWQFRCPLCGDSKKSKRKARGCIYEKEGRLRFLCMNCGESLSFLNLLEQLDPNLYKEYITKKYVSKFEEDEHEDLSFLEKLGFKTHPFPHNKNKIVDDKVKKLSKLKPSHAAIKYAVERQIPEQHWKHLYFTTQFEKFCSRIQNRQEPRIVLPCYDASGVVYAAQGRILPGYNGIRYKLYRMSGDLPILFGLNRLNTSEPIYVVEGPIDSLFLPNALAICSAHLYSIHDNLKEHGHDIDTKNFTLIFDNEKRNPHIVSRMQKAVAMGYKVCVFPDSIEQKDINDMVISGIDVCSLVDENSFSGIEASLRINKWKRCNPERVFMRGGDGDSRLFKI